jgi:hypothetical protein
MVRRAAAPTPEAEYELRLWSVRSHRARLPLRARFRCCLRRCDAGRRVAGVASPLSWIREDYRRSLDVAVELAFARLQTRTQSPVSTTRTRLVKPCGSRHSVLEVQNHGGYEGGVLSWSILCLRRLLQEIAGLLRSSQSAGTNSRGLRPSFKRRPKKIIPMRCSRSGYLVCVGSLEHCGDSRLIKVAP